MSRDEQQFIAEMHSRIKSLHADGPICGEAYLRLYQAKDEAKVKAKKSGKKQGGYRPDRPVVTYLLHTTLSFLVTLSFLAFFLSHSPAELSTSVPPNSPHHYQEEGVLVARHYALKLEPATHSVIPYQK